MNDPETVSVDIDAPIDDRARREALARVLGEAFGMSDEDAAEIAGTVVEQFAGEDEANDETLDPSVRSIFYTLEAKKVLSFRRTEYTTDAGERRRGFWWRIREEALAEAVTSVHVASEEDVYAALPKDAWTARQHA